MKNTKKKSKKVEVPDTYQLDLLESSLEVRKRIYQHIKELHDKELALLVAAELRYKKYIGQK